MTARMRVIGGMMDFSWSAQQHELFQQALHFATAALNTGMREREREQGFDHSAWRALGRFGATGLCVPETYGGLGLDALTTARVLEALGNGSADLGLLFAVSAHLFACAMPIVEHGSDHLKAKVLPRLAVGDWIGANAITEAEAGSDVF